jgi:hypothetical protein
MTLSDIFNPHLVDKQLHQAAIDRLSACSSATSTYALDNVFIALLRTAQEHLPSVTTYQAMFGDTHHLVPSFDERGIRYWFWIGLCNADLYPVVYPRIADHSHKPGIQAALLTLLEPQPIDIALQTWIAVSVHWLQICNTTWFFDQIHKEHQLLEADVPRHIAGMMALLYY